MCVKGVESLLRVCPVALGTGRSFKVLPKSFLCVFSSIQIKCQQYWPSAGETTYGSFVAKVLETCTYAQYTVRTIEYYPVSVQLLAQTPPYIHR